MFWKKNERIGCNWTSEAGKAAAHFAANFVANSRDVTVLYWYNTAVTENRPESGRKTALKKAETSPAARKWPSLEGKVLSGIYIPKPPLPSSWAISGRV